MRAPRRWIFVGVLASTGCGGGGTDVSPPPPPPPAPAVATVDVSPTSAAPLPGETVQLSATPRTAGGAEVSGKIAQWSSSAPTIATVSQTGLVSAVSAGAATITATVDGKAGSATISVRASDSLPGAPTAPAVSAIQRQPFVSRPEDYSTDDPELPGVPLSFNTLTVAFAADATVGAVNAILGEFNAKIVGGLPGTPGQAPGILFLRLPTKSHGELIPRLALLRQRGEVVAAAQDIVLTPADVPASNGSNPPEWQWSLAPAGGAWGPIAIRAPEMWNLNDAIRKTGVATGVGILDVGFAGHADLVYAANLSPAAAPHRHGTHVAGTIGATFGNGLGVDGINPFASLVVDVGGTTGSMVSDLAALLAARPDLQVVSISLAYSWRPAFNIDTRVGVKGAAARAQADIDGLLCTFALQQIQSAGRALPVIVVAAGNDSQGGDQDAVYATPFANAALAHQAAPVIVVEAVGLNAPGSYSRAVFSNLGGHVSAPGVGIVSTDSNNSYVSMDGTSMATPHVSGLVSYLYALDPALPAPTMTTNLVRDLLVATAHPTVGAAPMIDAFAAALSLDSIRGDHRTRSLLLDVDDGTIDGNTRVTAGGAVVTTDTKGDGKVDMADFRRWRDWLLEAEQPTTLALNGAPNNPKKDLNGDGTVNASVAAENIHPRGDFNGDGEMSRTKTARVPGVKNGQPATDLEVFQTLFQDPDYQSSDLPGLLDSWDLDVDPAQCLAVPGVASVKTSVFPNGGTTPIAVRTHTPSSRRHVITLPVPAVSQDVLLEAMDATGNVIASKRDTFSEEVGADVTHDPLCTGLFIQVGFPTAITAGQANILDIRVGEKDPATGVTTFLQGVTIDVVAAGGTVTPSTGQTDAQGEFLSSATLGLGNTLLTLFITATKTDGTFLTKIVTSSTACGRIVPGTLSIGNDADVLANADVKQAGGVSLGGGIRNAVVLNCLTTVTGDLTIGSNSGPTVSLPHLASVGGNLEVFANSNLASFSLGALTVGGSLEIGNNLALTSFSFGALNVGHQVEIDGNLALTTFHFAGGHFGGDLFILQNNALQSFGIGAVTVLGDLDIDLNRTLVTLLAGRGSVGGQLEIRNNFLLSNQAAMAWAAGFAVTGVVQVDHNHDP